MKKNSYRTPQVFLGILSFCMFQMQASTLKIYNMTDAPIYCSTKPIAQCGSNSEYCIAKPYQSIFRPNILLFDLPDEGIKEFIWKRVGSLCYKAVVNLQYDEFATIEILGDGWYKFKGKKYQVDEF